VTAYSHKPHGFSWQHLFDASVNYPVKALASEVDFVDRFIDGYKAMQVPPYLGILPGVINDQD